MSEAERAQLRHELRRDLEDAHGLVMLERFVIADAAHRPNEIAGNIVQCQREELVVVDPVLAAHAHRLERRREICVRREDEVAGTVAVKERSVECDDAGFAAKLELRIALRCDDVGRQSAERRDVEARSEVIVRTIDVELDASGIEVAHCRPRSVNLGARGECEKKCCCESENLFHGYFFLYCAISRMKSALTPLAARRTRSRAVRFE